MDIDAVTIRYKCLTRIKFIVIVPTVCNLCKSGEEKRCALERKRQEERCFFFNLQKHTYLAVPSLLERAVKSMMPLEVLQTQLSAFPFGRGHTTSPVVLEQTPVAIREAAAATTSNTK